jgi:hypothetical protein
MKHLVTLLNKQLADTIDLRLQARQARFNVRGLYARELGLMFDGLAGELRSSRSALALSADFRPRRFDLSLTSRICLIFQRTLLIPETIWTRCFQATRDTKWTRRLISNRRKKSATPRRSGCLRRLPYRSKTICGSLKPISKALQLVFMVESCRCGHRSSIETNSPLDKV